MSLRSAPKSITLDSSSNRGALLIHGFTASPDEMQELGQRLHQESFHVEIPLLPGHGTKPEDLNAVTKDDWLQAVEEAYRLLAKKCSKVFVCGLSMGATLALRLSIQHPEIPAVVCFSAPYWIQRKWIHLLLTYLDLTRQWSFFVPREIKKDPPSAPSGRFVYPLYPSGGLRNLVRLVNETKGMLPRTRADILLMHSLRDSLIPYASMKDLSRHLPKNPEMITLERSEHVITCEPEKEKVFTETIRFLNQHS